MNSPAPNSTNKSDEFIKIVFLGSTKVGKTSIIQRFLHNHFDSKYTPTVEDMHSKKYVVRDHLVRLTLVDTAGSFDFPVMLRLCIAKANAFVLVFSNDNPESLTQAGYLLSQIKLQRKDYDSHNCALPKKSTEAGEVPDQSVAIQPPPPVTIVCNKSDLPAHPQVNESALMEWLLTHGLKPSQFVYSSAKTNESIMSIFKSLWTQNEVSNAISFERWDGLQKSSFCPNRSRTPPDPPGTDFSALNDAVSGGDQSQNAESPKSDKSSHKSRSSFFRNSLRLRRNSSSKSNKYKPDVVKLECVLS